MQAPAQQSVPAKSKSTQGSNPRLSMWLSKLPSQVMPLNSKLAQQVLRELQDDEATAESLANIIQQEPTLCLKLYLKAGRQLKERESNIQGLVHLVGLLGFEQIAHIINKAQKQDRCASGQQELFAASLFAAELAMHLLPEKHGTRGERFYLPSLLLNAPLWLMWSTAPKIMHHGQALASKQKKSLKTLGQKTLGFSLETLFKQTQLFLPLPELSLKALKVDLYDNIELWSQLRRKSAEQVRELCDTNKAFKPVIYNPEVGLYLINHYALAIYLDWHGKHIRRWEKLLAIHLGIETDKLREQVREIAKLQHETAEEHSATYLSGRFSPLYRFRQLHKALPSDKATNNEQILGHYIQQLRTNKQSSDCLHLALEAFREGMHVEHCIILSIEKQRLHIPLSFGLDKTTDASQKAGKTHFNLAECGALFNKLLHKPTAIQVEASQLKRLEPQLPQALLRLWQPQPCGLMSLFRHGQPYAIVICDHKYWNRDRQEQFKKIGKQLAYSLKTCRI